jgi:hypothetical protein
MFYKVQVLDAKGKLKKLFTSQMLSKRHWDLFPDNIKKSEKEKNLKQKKINLIRLKQNIIDLLGVEITGKK